MAHVLTIGKRHWFVLLLPLGLAIALASHQAFPWRDIPVRGELMALFDWGLFVPMLYVLCYRSDASRRAAFLAFVGAASLGIWFAGKFVPVEAQHLLRGSAALRWVVSLLMFALEGAAIIAAMRMTSSGRPNANTLRDQGIPLPIAHLVALEVRFWRWVFRRAR